jgi:hypothetical protein
MAREKLRQRQVFMKEISSKTSNKEKDMKN